LLTDTLLSSQITTPAHLGVENCITKRKKIRGTNKYCHAPLKVYHTSTMAYEPASVKGMGITESLGI
jgi:hypothetical protein